MKQSYLRPLRRAAFPLRLLFVDVETVPVNPLDSDNKEAYLLEVSIICSIFIEQNRDGSIIEQEERFFMKKGADDDIIAMFHEYLRKIMVKRGGLQIMSHNTAFDIPALQIFAFMEKNGYALNNWFVNGMVSLFKFKFNKDNYVSIVDTANYFPISVRLMGKSLGLEKLDIDFERATYDDLSVYCMRDVEIIMRFYVKFCEFLRKRGCGIGISLASTALRYFRTVFLEDNVICLLTSSSFKNKELLFYRGGRTEVFNIGRIETRIYGLDVNSLYPFVMEREVPVKYLFQLRAPTVSSILEYQNRGFGVFVEATLENRENWLAIRSPEDKKLIFPLGTFRAYLTNCETSYAIEHGYVTTIHRCYVFEMGAVLKPYIENLYAEKERATREGDNGERTIIKLLMNSLYGKFAQKRKETIEMDPSLYDIFDDGELYCHVSPSGHREYGTLHKVGGSLFLCIKKDEMAQNSFSPIASEITAMARMHMWKLMKIAGLENVFYMDTDSLYVNEAGYLNLVPYIDEYLLGALKIEHEIEFMEIFGLKDYILGDDTVKRKGIPLSAELKADGYNFVSFDKWTTKMKDNTMNNASIRLRTRQPVRNYTKGRVNKNGRITPFELQ